MRPSVSSSQSRTIAKLAAASVLALAAAGCSMGTERFASNPFGGSADGGSRSAYNNPPQQTQLPPVQAAPSGDVSSAPLAAPNEPAPTSAAPYQSRYHDPDSTSSITPVPSDGGPAGWSAVGGSTVTARGGDTARTLAERYGVPEDAIRSANHLHGSALAPGQRVVIPVYRTAAVPSGPTRTPGPRTASLESSVPRAPMHRTASERAPMPQATPRWVVGPKPAAERAREARAAGHGGIHVVASGETLYSVARETHVDVHQLAAANHVGLDHHVTIGERLTVPGHGTPVASAGATPARAAPVPPPARHEEAKADAAPHHGEQRTASLSAAPAAAPKSDVERTASISANTGAPAFRWPVQGRIIAGFGHKPDGTTNDGINLAVPEGTPIQAAANGVVAYAGNELKGYGNLVLLRHADGYVTAYAHNSKIMVHKGETVRRGEVIARAGKSGSVDAPQLHFELRRGATPVNPLKYLPQG